MSPREVSQGYIFPLLRRAKWRVKRCHFLFGILYKDDFQPYKK
jgi:hypothetical protein